MGLFSDFSAEFLYLLWQEFWKQIHPNSLKLVLKIVQMIAEASRCFWKHQQNLSVPNTQ